MKKTFLIFALFLFSLAGCVQATPTAVVTEAQATPIAVETEIQAPPTVVETEVQAAPTTVATEAPAPDTAALLAQLGGEPCPEGDFTCITLQVPLDHFQPDGRSLDVVFAVLPASGERKGMFVTANGGPGVSGLLSADDYTAAFDLSIPEHFDIVFFDQRGVGLSGGLQCATAAAKFYRADWEATTPEEEQALSQTAHTFADECVAEMGNPDMLPYLGTAQAIEDLEAFRAAMGAEKFWLYGESYGTQFAQTYAAAHPERLAGLILDGTVDLTLDGLQFYAQQAQAFNDVMVMTLKACNADEQCAADMGDDALTIYDALAGHLREEPMAFTFPLPSGGKAQRSFSFSDLETAASGYNYSETERMIFLRALAYFARDRDLAPLARVLYNSLILDPETEQAVPDPSYSDAVYYAVECQDYAYPGQTPEERAQAYLRAGDAVEASLPRFGSLFYGDLPCAFWPQTSTYAARPAPLKADGIPTLVLGATADPATPYQNGVEVFSRLSDGYQVTETGGPHIIFGWGVSCVDDLVTAFLVDDQAPPRKTTCEGVVVDEFVPLAPRNAADFADPLEAMASADDEIYYLPEYYYWDYETPTAVGCPYGGRLAFELSDSGEAFTLEACAFSEGFVMTGDGSYDYDSEVFTLSVTVSGLASGRLTYTRDADGNLFVTGEYDGRQVELGR
jgi:pimeloyl-ACP methyl ester carboxylesterase